MSVESPTLLILSCISCASSYNKSVMLFLFIYLSVVFELNFQTALLKLSILISSHFCHFSVPFFPLNVLAARSCAQGLHALCFLTQGFPGVSVFIIHIPSRALNYLNWANNSCTIGIRSKTLVYKMSQLNKIAYIENFLTLFNMYWRGSAAIGHRKKEVLYHITSLHYSLLT